MRQALKPRRAALAEKRGYRCCDFVQCLSFQRSSGSEKRSTSMSAERVLRCGAV